MGEMDAGDARSVVQRVRKQAEAGEYSGPCCLLNGQTRQGPPLHIVCTTACEMVILITVYEPKPPKWISPTQRRQQS